MEQIMQELSEIKKKLDKLDKIEEEIQNLKQDVNVLKQDVENIKRDMKSLDEKVESVELIQLTMQAIADGFKARPGSMFKFKEEYDYSGKGFNDTTIVKVKR